MPGVVRKLLVFSTVDGLVLQPATPRTHTSGVQQAIRIDYKGNVGPLLTERCEHDAATPSFEAHGVVGLFKVASSIFLISICGREQVAQVRGKAIYKITDVALIPIASQTEADTAIAATHEHVQRHSKELGNDEADSESDDAAPSVTDSLVEDHPTSSNEVKDVVTGQTTPTKRRTSVAEDVIQRKGVYGRFANKWFSRKGWSKDSRRMQGLSSENSLGSQNVSKNVESVVPNEQGGDPTSPSEPNKTDETLPDPVQPEDIPKAMDGDKETTTVVLLPRILKTTKMYFSSGNFFFSYDYDLSHSVGNQQANSSVPLFRQYDPLFFWNQHITSPFVDAGQHSFVLPVIQGFVGQRAFSVKLADEKSESLVIDSNATPDDIKLDSWNEDTAKNGETGPEGPNTEFVKSTGSKDFILTLISRRSVKRAGLRYLRRGTDDEGYTANTVETEQILSSPTWDTTNDKTCSFTQIRGSIPLFFSQSPYSLKPQVNTWGSFETNASAFKRHFNILMSRYGEIHCASLIDKHGNEAKIGELYEKHAHALSEEGGIDGKGRKLGFEWFDFHNVCRGMRFENVSQLMDTIEPFMQASRWTEIFEDRITQKQSGVLRTNCMDCLDRTNVVQSACARTALEAQLSAGKFDIDLQNDPSTSWFNTLWADNGDNISRQYAGTAALKGDFTRTRKRSGLGALTDFGLTLTRYYNNIVNDYFAQAVIDYLLGRAADTIFAEFEADMKSSDYFIDVRKVRQQAIVRSAGIVIEDHDEDLIHGWTLSVPTSANRIKTATFEEAVLLLTEKALYFCRLDWGTEKVHEFERIPLENVQGMIRGVYITSTLAQRHVNTAKNVGFVLRYRADGDGKLVRRNTRALDSGAGDGLQKEGTQPVAKKEDTGRFLAFKALPPASNSPSSSVVISGTPETEIEVVKSICEEIARITRKHNSADDALDQALKIEDKDIISLEDARKSTSYLEQIGYSLKKLVW